MAMSSSMLCSSCPCSSVADATSGVIHNHNACGRLPQPFAYSRVQCRRHEIGCRSRIATVTVRAQPLIEFDKCPLRIRTGWPSPPENVPCPRARLERMFYIEFSPNERIRHLMQQIEKQPLNEDLPVLRTRHSLTCRESQPLLNRGEPQLQHLGEIIHVLPRNRIAICRQLHDFT